MTFASIIRAADIKAGLDVYVVTFPHRKTVRARAAIVQIQAHGHVQVAFESGDIFSMPPTMAVGRIPARKVRHANHH